MKTAGILSVALVGVVMAGCARENRWHPGRSDRPAAERPAATRVEQGGDAYRALKLIQGDGGYRLGNSARHDIIATLSRTPAPEQGPLAGEENLKVFVPAGSEVNVGSHEYRIVSASYR